MLRGAKTIEKGGRKVLSQYLRGSAAHLIQPALCTSVAANMHDQSSQMLLKSSGYRHNGGNGSNDGFRFAFPPLSTLLTSAAAATAVVFALGSNSSNSDGTDSQCIESSAPNQPVLLATSTSQRVDAPAPEVKVTKLRRTKSMVEENLHYYNGNATLIPVGGTPSSRTTNTAKSGLMTTATAVGSSTAASNGDGNSNGTDNSSSNGNTNGNSSSSSGRFDNWSKSEVMILSGNSNKELANTVAKRLNMKLGKAKVSQFADGESSIQVVDDVRGKDIYILQSGDTPVNDNMMELLLYISCLQRASAKRVTAIIPFFPFKHHRRGTPINTGMKTRFLWSLAADFAKMLQVMGVDRIITVDMQRPGQGHEACFFDNRIPVENIMTTERMVTYLVTSGLLRVTNTSGLHPPHPPPPPPSTATTTASFPSSPSSPGGMATSGGNSDSSSTDRRIQRFNTIDGTCPANQHQQQQRPIVVVSPNSANVKSARKFQMYLANVLDGEGAAHHIPNRPIGLAAFVQGGHSSGWQDPELATLLGSVEGCDAIIVDEIIDTGTTVVSLAKKLKEYGANRILVCASHGLFTGNALERIDLSSIDHVVVSNSIKLPNDANIRCPKILQVDISDLISRVITASHFRYHGMNEEELVNEEEDAKTNNLTRESNTTTISSNNANGGNSGSSGSKKSIGGGGSGGGSKSTGAVGGGRDQD